MVLEFVGFEDTVAYKAYKSARTLECHKVQRLRILQKPRVTDSLQRSEV